MKLKNLTRPLVVFALYYFIIMGILAILEIAGSTYGMSSGKIIGSSIFGSTSMVVCLVLYLKSKKESKEE